MIGSTTGESLFVPPDHDVKAWPRVNFPDIAEEFCSLVKEKAFTKGIGPKQAASLNLFELSAHLICNYWTNFAKTGDPNVFDVDGTPIPRWTPYTLKSQLSMQVLDKSRMGKNRTEPTGFYLNAPKSRIDNKLDATKNKSENTVYIEVSNVLNFER